MPIEEMGHRALPQPADVDNRVVLAVVGGFLLFVAAAIAGILLFLNAQVPSAFLPRDELRFPAPELQTSPQADLARFETHLTPGARILVNTGWHRHFGKPEFFTDFPSFTLAAARYLAARRIRLLGMDVPTPGRNWLELHHVLLAPDVEMVLVESMANLDALPDTFTFAGFPLCFRGRDGSPIRAVAVCD